MQKYFLYFSLNVLILCMCTHSCYFRNFHFVKAGTEVCSASYTFTFPLFYLDYMQYIFIGTPRFTYLSSLNCRSSMKKLKKNKLAKKKVNYLWFHHMNTTFHFFLNFLYFSHLHIWYLYCYSHSRNATLYSALVFYNYLHFPYHL